MVRSLRAVVAGYTLFWLANALLFVLTGRDPRAEPSLEFVLLWLGNGVMSGVVAGLVAGWLARRAWALHGLAVSACIVISAGIAMATDPIGATQFLQWVTIIVFAPLAWLGAVIWAQRQRRVERSSPGTAGVGA